MGRARSTFRKRDVARLVEAARAAGLRVAGVRVDASGTITVVTASELEQDSGQGRGNEWDSVLNVQ